MALHEQSDDIDITEVYDDGEWLVERWAEGLDVFHKHKIIDPSEEFHQDDYYADGKCHKCGKRVPENLIVLIAIGNLNEHNL